jgi:hypothetical protein
MLGSFLKQGIMGKGKVIYLWKKGMLLVSKKSTNKNYNGMLTWDRKKSPAVRENFYGNTGKNI